MGPGLQFGKPGCVSQRLEQQRLVLRCDARVQRAQPRGDESGQALDAGAVEVHRKGLDGRKSVRLERPEADEVAQPAGMLQPATRHSRAQREPCKDRCRWLREQVPRRPVCRSRTDSDLDQVSPLPSEQRRLRLKLADPFAPVRTEHLAVLATVQLGTDQLRAWVAPLLQEIRQHHRCVAPLLHQIRQHQHCVAAPRVHCAPLVGGVGKCRT
jgi:hypothetical protein